MRLGLAAITCALAYACFDPPPVVAPTIPSPPGDRDGLGTRLGEACENLRRLRCEEGNPTAAETCYEHLLHQSEWIVVPDDCVAKAADRESVRACGTKNTLRFRCR